MVLVEETEDDEEGVAAAQAEDDGTESREVDYSSLIFTSPQLLGREIFFFGREVFFGGERRS